MRKLIGQVFCIATVVLTLAFLADPLLNGLTAQCAACTTGCVAGGGEAGARSHA